MDSQTALLYNKSLRFLSFRSRSVSEMQKYLAKNKASDNQTTEIIQKLTDLCFLNDHEFAEKWVEDRKKSHPRSLNILKQELRLKGIPPEIIEEVIIPRKEAGEDLAMAKDIVRKFINKIPFTPRSPAGEQDEVGQDVKSRLVSRLQSKGFSWEIIKAAIDESLKKE